MAIHFASRRWQDQLMVAIGVWLFVSPWILGYPSDSSPAVNAYVAGAIIAVLAAFDLVKTLRLGRAAQHRRRGVGGGLALAG